MKKIFVSGIFTLLLTMFGDHPVKANQNDLSLNTNSNNIAQEGVLLAGCAFDNNVKQTNMLNGMKDAISDY